MIIGIHSITLFYEYFYQKKYNLPKYQFKPSIQAVSRIESFLSALDKEYDLNTLGVSFLSSYFMFQFNRTHKQVFNRFASRSDNGTLIKGGKLQVYDIIGKQALKHWIDRDWQYDYVLRRCDFASEHSVSLGEIAQLVDVGAVGPLPVFRSEEIERNRFLNTPKGLLNCLEKTSLFHHRSFSCISCQSKIDCKKLLEANYQYIYVERGYGK